MYCLALLVPLQEPPFVFKHVNPKTKEVTYDGYCVELMTRIARELGMSLEWREPKDGVYGALQEDGSWNGMVKELIDDVSNGR